MKKISFTLLLLCCSFNSSAQEKETTMYYFIRHAEKEITNKADKNPQLTQIGLNRATYWSQVFQNIFFDEVYSTNYNRTIQTALPTAKTNKLEISNYNPRDLFNDDFIKDTKGKTVLVVGHSNTTPQFVNKILGYAKYHEMDETNFSNLYIITITDNIVTDTLLKIDYF